MFDYVVNVATTTTTFIKLFLKSFTCFSVDVQKL